MPWIKVDDHYDEHPKFARAGPLGVVMWLAGLAYCNRNLTDGFIPWSVARSLVAWEYLRPAPDGAERDLIWSVGAATGMHGQDVDCAFVIDLLLDSGLWAEAAGGYLVHDYGDYQPTKEDILSERKAWAERKAKSRRDSARDSRADSPRESRARHTRPVPVPVPVPVPTGSSEPVARDGLPNLDGEALAALEAASGHVASMAGDKTLNEYDRLVGDHGLPAVVVAFGSLANGKRMTARQLVWGAVKVLEPFVSDRVAADTPVPTKPFVPRKLEPWEQEFRDAVELQNAAARGDS